MPRTIAIGDIHGCRTELRWLLEQVEPTPEDQLVFLGDYIDRGPNSRGVLDLLIELNQTHNAVFLIGNHDVWMIRAQRDREWLTSWFTRSVGGLETVRSYGNNQKAIEAHCYFLETVCRNYYETDSHIFVHGAAQSDLPLPDQDEHTLLWERVYNQAPHYSGKRIICGHTSQKSGHPYNAGHAVCIDTNCAGGGYLTALCVETDEIWQVSGAGETRHGFLEEEDKTDLGFR